MDFYLSVMPRLFLTAMRRLVIVGTGEQMNIPNTVEPLVIEYEKLESEPQPVRDCVLFTASLIGSHSILELNQVSERPKRGRRITRKTIQVRLT